MIEVRITRDEILNAPVPAALFHVWLVRKLRAAGIPATLNGVELGEITRFTDYDRNHIVFQWEGVDASDMPAKIKQPGVALRALDFLVMPLIFGVATVLTHVFVGVDAGRIAFFFSLLACAWNLIGFIHGQRARK